MHVGFPYKPGPVHPTGVLFCMFLRVESFSILFNHGSFPKAGSVSPELLIAERRTGKNGEASTRMLGSLTKLQKGSLKRYILSNRAATNPLPNVGMAATLPRLIPRTAAPRV